MTPKAKGRRSARELQPREFYVWIRGWPNCEQAMGVNWALHGPDGACSSPGDLDKVILVREVVADRRERKKGKR